MDFWSKVSRFILTRRYFILTLIAAATWFLASQMQYMRFSYTEANLLPENHEINIDYNKFLELFGEEGNLVVIGFNDSTFFTEKNILLWEKHNSGGHFAAMEKPKELASDVNKFVKDVI